MKTFAIVLLASLVGCATDEQPAPADKVLATDKVGDDTADIEEGVSDSAPDAIELDRAWDRIERSFKWAEEVKISGKSYTLLHAESGETLLVANDQ